VGGWVGGCIHTYIHTHKHTHIHTYIQTDRQTDRQTYIHTYIHIHIYIMRMQHAITLSLPFTCLTSTTVRILTQGSTQLDANTPPTTMAVLAAECVRATVSFSSFSFFLFFFFVSQNWVCAARQSVADRESD
jgi:hypothetical protein